MNNNMKIAFFVATTAAASAAAFWLLRRRTPPDISPPSPEPEIQVPPSQQIHGPSPVEMPMEKMEAETEPKKDSSNLQIDTCAFEPLILSANPVDSRNVDLGVADNPTPLDFEGEDSDNGLDDEIELSGESGDDCDSDVEISSTAKWKESLVARTQSRRNSNLMQLVYGEAPSKSGGIQDARSSSDDESDDDEAFFKPKNTSDKKSNEKQSYDYIDAEDCTKFVNKRQLKDWSDEGIIKSIRDRFVTGDWSKAAQRGQITYDVNEDIDGDFEDVETGEIHNGQSGNDTKQNQNISTGDDPKKEERRLKKLALSAQFDNKLDEPEISDVEDVKEKRGKFHRDRAQGGEYYDKLKEEIELLKQTNISELNDLDETARVEMEGFRTGTYLRLEVHDVPFEMVEHFDPCHPILVGGIGLGEENVGYMQVPTIRPSSSVSAMAATGAAMANRDDLVPSVAELQNGDTPSMEDVKPRIINEPIEKSKPSKLPEINESSQCSLMMLPDDFSSAKKLKITETETKETVDKCKRSEEEMRKEDREVEEEITSLSKKMNRLKEEELRRVKEAAQLLMTSPGNSCTRLADGKRLFSCGTSKDGDTHIVEWNESEGTLKRRYKGLQKPSTGVVQFDMTKNSQATNKKILGDHVSQKCQATNKKILGDHVSQKCQATNKKILGDHVSQKCQATNKKILGCHVSQKSQATNKIILGDHVSQNSQKNQATKKKILRDRETNFVQKKLVLVLDLDNTLLHSSELKLLSHNEKNLLNYSSDLIKWYLTEPIVTKLRPFVGTFLEEVSSMFELFIYTKGSGPYARGITKILDPNHIYFTSEMKIISRDRRPQHREKKNLFLVDRPPKHVVIVDDRWDVWRDHMENLIKVEKYEYFPVPDYTGSFLESGEDEEGGVLARVLDVLRRVHTIFFHDPAHASIPLALRDVRPILKHIATTMKGCNEDLKV